MGGGGGACFSSASNANTHSSKSWNAYIGHVQYGTRVLAYKLDDVGAEMRRPNASNRRRGAYEGLVRILCSCCCEGERICKTYIDGLGFLECKCSFKWFLTSRHTLNIPWQVSVDPCPFPYSRWAEENPNIDVVFHARCCLVNSMNRNCPGSVFMLLVAKRLLRNKSLPLSLAMARTV